MAKVPFMLLHGLVGILLLVLQVGINFEDVGASTNKMAFGYVVISTDAIGFTYTSHRFCL